MEQLKREKQLYELENCQNLCNTEWELKKITSRFV